MKCLILFPPQWVPFNPHLAPPAIQGILKEKGHEVNVYDLNIEFYNSVLTPDFIVKSLQRAFDEYNANAANIFGQYSPDKQLNEYPVEYQRLYNKYNGVKKIAESGEYNYLLENVEKAARIFRSKKDYYNLHLLELANAVLDKTAKLLSLLYSPSSMYFSTAQAQVYYTLDDLKRDCLDQNGNIIYNYYQSILPEILKTDYDYIGISLGDYTQLVGGLTLAKLLKERTTAHINIGGNLFGRYTDVLINNPEFFQEFADSIICNEGERPVTELMEHLKGEREIEDVSNLIYLKDGEIKVNKEEEPIKITELPSPDFSCLPLDKYFTPEVIFNIQASRNCYWKKCAFCTHHFGSKYAIKSVDRTVQEIKDLQEKFGAKYFHFVDEAMTPSYLRKLSEKIIEEGLKIDFYIYGRLEKEFTPDLFKIARQAGLRFVLWGFEAANERVYNLMNKGNLCSKEERLKIIQHAFDADIWNHLFIMFGFPSETLDEAKETVHFLKENRGITSFSMGGTFVLLDGAPVLKNLKKYTITNIKRVRSGFSFAHKFETYRGMDAKQLKELDAYKKEYWELPKIKYLNSWSREKVFLYVCKYGTKNISRMKNKIWL